MSMQWPLALALHQLGTLIWIGGMFFAHFVLRPVANERLAPPERLPLMLAVFDRFFPLVWVAIALLWGSGLWVFLALAGARMGWHVHAMMTLAALMTLIFVYIWFSPYRALARAVAQADWPAAAAHLALIRRLIATNLTLGLVTALLGAAGPTLIAALSRG